MIEWNSTVTFRSKVLVLMTILFICGYQKRLVPWNEMIIDFHCNHLVGIF